MNIIYMKVFVTVALLIGLFPVYSVYAQDESAPVETFYRAEVVEITAEQEEDVQMGDVELYVQSLRVRILSGRLQGQEEEIEYGSFGRLQRLSEGDGVIVVHVRDQFYVFDRFRLPALAGIAALFVVLATIFAGIRGMTSLAGLGVSVLILAMFVVPQIIAGRNPLVVSMIGAFVIAIVSIYLAHGFSRRTSVAVVSTLITVVISIILAQVFVWLAQLTGAGSDEAHYLQTSPVSGINLRGLLLGGIIIGALGVLDDITTSQAAAVDEISKANPSLSKKDLFLRASSIGREHITALVNTLALAYVGASLPALLLFVVHERPWWVVINMEIISEEIVRTLVGSVALVTAVPITTLLAVHVFSKYRQHAKKEA